MPGVKPKRPATTSASLLALIGIFDIAGTLASGWLTDRVDPRWLLAAYYSLRGLSLLVLGLLGGLIWLLDDGASFSELREPWKVSSRQAVVDDGSGMSERKQTIRAFADARADTRDAWISANPAYFDDDRNFMRFIVREGARVLELGSQCRGQREDVGDHDVGPIRLEVLAGDVRGSLHRLERGKVELRVVRIPGELRCGDEREALSFDVLLPTRIRFDAHIVAAISQCPAKGHDGEDVSGVAERTEQNLHRCSSVERPSIRPSCRRG